MRLSVVAVLLVLLMVAPAVTGVGATAEPGSAERLSVVDSGYTTSASVTATGARAATVAPQIGDTPSALSITVAVNGSARWQFRYRVPLENDSQREDFRAFAERFESEETELFRGFTTRASALTRQATNTTGREMNATAFDREAYVDPSPMRDFGVVTLSFRWTAFAEVRAERVVVADVFEGGFYLGPGQRLVVRPGPDLAFESVTPEATPSDPDSLRDSDSVTWTGERRFTDNRPRIVFGPVRTGTEPPASGDGSDGGDSDGPDTADGDAGLSWLVGILLAGGLLGTIALLVARRRGLFGFGLGPASAGSTGLTAETVDDSETTEATDDGGANDTTTDGSSGDTASGASAGTDEADTEEAGGGAAVSGADLKSDEDRVVSMLEANEGQMRQSRIVEETGWSKSKVSMLLSEMEDEGLVSKLRLGRENVVSLPEADPTEDGTDGA